MPPFNRLRYSHLLIQVGIFFAANLIRDFYPAWKIFAEKLCIMENSYYICLINN